MAGAEQRPERPQQGATPDKTPQRERRLIEAQRSVIPACDIPKLADFERLVKETRDIEGIGGYKIGIELALTYGIPRVAEAARKHTEKPLIYDHQKAGNDIPDMGKKLAKLLKNSDVRAGILFPFAGPETQARWTEAFQEEGIVVMVGGEMTHAKFLKSQGGYIADDAPERIYRLGAEMGVKDFVVPGNKIDSIAAYKRLLDELLGEGNFTLYSPGFIAQGGNFTDAAAVAGENYHGIVGRAITEAVDMREAAKELTSKL